MHVRTKVYLDEETLARLDALSRRSAKSHAELIRDALRAFVGVGAKMPSPFGLEVTETEQLGDTTEERGNIGRSPRVM